MLVICTIKEGEATTATLSSGDFKKCSNGDIVDVKAEFLKANSFFKKYVAKEEKKESAKDEKNEGLE